MMQKQLSGIKRQGTWKRRRHNQSWHYVWEWGSVKKDYKKAADLYQTACDKGEKEAAITLQNWKKAANIERRFQSQNKIRHPATYC